MLALVVQLKIKPEHQQAFELAMRQMVQSTRDNEPDVLLYQLCKSQTDQFSYRLLEIYASRAALDSHLATPWYKEVGPKVQPFIAEPPVMEYLDTVD